MKSKNQTQAETKTVTSIQEFLIDHHPGSWITAEAIAAHAGTTVAEVHAVPWPERAPGYDRTDAAELLFTLGFRPHQD